MYSIVVVSSLQVLLTKSLDSHTFKPLKKSLHINHLHVFTHSGKMYSMSNDSKTQPALESIPIRTRDVTRLQRDIPVVINYRSNRGNNMQKTRTGTIMQTQALGEKTLRVWIYDNDNNRKIEVTIGNAMSDSPVRSQKTEKMVTIGSLTLLLAGDNTFTSPQDVQQQHIMNKRNNEYPHATAAAQISSNKSVLNWFNTHE